MGSSWSGFEPQNEVVKLQWAVMEASEFKITAQEFQMLLGISGSNQSEEKAEEGSSLEGLEFLEP